MKKIFRSLAPLIALGACLVAAHGEEETKVSDDSLRVRGIFDAPLPGTEKKSSLRLLLHPHFGDLTNRNALRVPVGLRYGVTENWDVSTEIEGYFSHGLKKESFGESAGFSQIRFGTKYRVGKFPFEKWDTAIGIDYSHPVGAPPLELTDGLEHISPFFTLARNLESRPDLRVFWGVGADLINRTSVAGALTKNELGDDTLTLTGGVVWTRNRFNYMFETSWTSADYIGRPIKGNVFTVRPGLIWTVPRKYTAAVGGQWLLGFALRASHGPDGNDFGGGAKLRVNFDFKKLLHRKKTQ